MAISIGAAAIDRNSWGVLTWTFVGKNTPANATGTIDTIEIWCNTDATNVEVATFFVVSGNYLSTRDSETIGNVTAGSKQTFTLNSVGGSISIDVVTNDYLGVRGSTGQIDYTWDAGTGYWIKDGDYIPCTNQLFTVVDGRDISLHGTGTEEGGTAWEKSLSDSISIGDSISKGIGKARIDSLSLADNLGKGYGKNRSDSVIFAEIINKGTGLAKSEMLPVSDSISKGIGKNRVDTITITESISKGIGIFKVEAVAIIDSISKAISIVKSELVTIIDDLVAKLGIAHVLNLFDKVTIIDNLATKLGLSHVLNLFDKVIINDSISGILKIKTYLRQQISRMDSIRTRVSRMPPWRWIIRRFP